MRRVQIFLYIVLTAACWSGRSAAVANRVSPTDAEEAVWSAVLTTFVTDSTRQIIVVDSARALPARIFGFQELARRFPELSEEFIQRYIEANANGRYVPAFADFFIPVVRVDSIGLAQFEDAGNPDEYWEAFYSVYPRSPGLIRLFRVGFDEQHRRALVFVSRACGGRCGCGSYFLLSESGGAWMVDESSVAICS